MKVRSKGNIVQVTLRIRREIKVAMEELAAKQCHEEGGYVSLGRIFTEAARVLLRREGIAIIPLPSDEAPRPKPVKTLATRKVEARV